ncbi:MAG: YibE/F family protein [Meiothermus sp.]|uniref:YibE/F family protein n=1 Tax=Meiothermus sp. TaxID=1955249 RepID=UPI0025F3FCB9|nr:YibE/F family protein [Meiothermus sp.]MCS7058208.1 YibE/F family protein [Meiothermus sp.]MCS7194414.1 YibE/F family protein [Meiothermus sp.]MCX7739468.1 YibE/F family protein [Meiothermus sp.]MDW8091106.1 YibE/F family protein [Meiothermus sp.]MDW8481359.1 YibE/F family protein [Meiothermus sp.]
MRQALLLLALALLPFALAQEPSAPGTYAIARIVALNEGTATVEVGGRRVEAELPTEFVGFWVGQRVVVYQADGKTYIAEPYRIPYLWGLLGLFGLVTVALGRGKGLRGLLGTAASMGVLAFFVVPQISAGQNPLLVTFVGAFGILSLSIYFVHGVNRKTTAALIGTTLATAVALVLSSLLTEWMQFTGLTSEETFLARFQLGGQLDLVALYLAGVVVGALGALNDVTVTQAAVVQALVQANPRYRVRELYNRGMSVGFDHIGSLVNTLVLAYAAGSLPLLLLISKSDVPLVFLVNNETFAAEVVTMLVGSLALVLAVPLTTLVAAWLLRGRSLDYINRRWPR